MPHPVFSRRFIAAQGVTGTTPSVTVPAGHVYVIKQLTWYSNPFFAPARGFFRDLDSGAALFSCGTTSGTPGWFGFYGALIFEAGQAFEWHVDVTATDACDVYAGGYDLSDT